MLNKYQIRFSDRASWVVYDTSPEGAYDEIAEWHRQRNKQFPVRKWVTITLLEQDIKGYYFSVFRDADGKDYTLGGFSSNNHQVFVMAQEGVSPGVMSWDGFTPVCTVGSNLPGHYHFKSPHDWMGRPMAGGNFAYSCDSRTPRHPWAIHDRYETSQESWFLSR